uniref:Uncharacterized protein n=1 Tax=Candidatus Kentrum sp. TC TaxID=2126339 RepID=A0A450Z9N1_9GAMM|nr:MAG: hypothetical protein BECKTC1821E_GA0114239_10935 [Candidatus Kentron sp. TC]VFK50501.1 MAG: hypothetical protein BECKTC1821D_GA0114238_11062 [Candidatus Kentron sp. TC]VFK63492.1 MAG: hypothetical protein BECKTC1821F_GA0114240_10971 [Candidatus Kentron sp. TC]
MECCPQCSADLECFELLDNLQAPENTVYPQKGDSALSPENKWFMLISSSVLLLALIAASSYLHRRMDILATRLNEIESVLRDRKLTQNTTIMERQMEKREEKDFQNRIDDLDKRRTAAWRRIKAALAAYAPPTFDNLRIRP